MISISYCRDVLFECGRTRSLEGTCFHEFTMVLTTPNWFKHVWFQHRLNKKCLNHWWKPTLSPTLNPTFGDFWGSTAPQVMVKIGGTMTWRMFTSQLHTTSRFPMGWLCWLLWKLYLHLSLYFSYYSVNPGSINPAALAAWFIRLVKPPRQWQWCHLLRTKKAI